MNRRSFLGLLGSLPFLRWLKPKPRTYHGLLVEEPPPYPIPDLTNPLPHGDGMDHRGDALGYYRGVPFVADPSVPEGHYYMLSEPPRVKVGWSDEECVLNEGPAGQALVDQWLRRRMRD